ncbi:MAG: cation diffusion facilitator family transporter [Solirubrobacteraceae bacterium]
MGHAHDHGHEGHTHAGHSHGAGADARALRRALVLILVFMAVEVTAGILSSSLALLSDAGHMLTDAAALAISLVAARLAARPAAGAMTYGLGRAEILSAQANGLTLLVLGLLIVYGAIRHLVSPAGVHGTVVLIVALAGIVVNLAATRMLTPAEADRQRSLNLEGSYRHLLTDLFGFVATAIAAVIIIASGFNRADAIASLLIAALMLHAAYGLLRASVRIFMEAAPAGFDPNTIGHAMAAHAGVVEVHDLHIWEVTSGFVALSAHVVVRAGEECHELRRSLQTMLHDEFGLEHTTLQVDHDHARQPPLHIEVARHS